MYGYCLMLIGAYLLTLPFIFSLLLSATPIVCILLILMHQETLQKNFVIPQKIVPALRDSSWIESLIQTCMIASAQNKNLHIVIQHHDDISTYVELGCPVNSFLSKELLLTLVNSSDFHEGSFIYTQSDGTLIAINSSLRNITNKVFSDSVTEQISWQEFALSLSAKTDVVIVKSDRINNTFTVIMRGMITPKLTAHACSNLIVDYVQKSTPDKGPSHDRKNEKTQSCEQHRI